jgi:hypothetical protein
MNNLRQAAQQALEALEGYREYTPDGSGVAEQAITALRAALAEPEQEPVAIPKGWIPLRIEWEPGYPEDIAFGPPYLMNRLKKWLDKDFANLTAPQRTEPVQEPLTAEEVIEHFQTQVDTGSLMSFVEGVRYAERAHGIGGNA